MSKSFWISLVGLLAAAGCNTPIIGHDAGPLNDANPPGFDAGEAAMDSGMVGTGTAYVRLVNLIPAAPNLTVCLAAIPGTGVAPLSAHILGQPDPSIPSDGTLPYPGVSPYLPATIYDAPGFGYELRLYSREDLPFSALGLCPAEGASPTPIATARFTGSDLMVDHHYTLALIGVLPNTPVQCPSACPAVQTRVFEDFLTPTMGPTVRVRLMNAVPNLPYPIHVCFDLDYMSATMNGPLAPARSLPPPADTDGIAFGEVTPLITIPPVTSSGAFYTHATVPGHPDCDPATLLLGPTTVPLPVPASAPPQVARVFMARDVITNFAFGRTGADCTTAADCVAPSSVCVAAACTCDATHHCVDDLAGNLLPWRDFRGDLDAGVARMPDGGM